MGPLLSVNVMKRGRPLRFRSAFIPALLALTLTGCGTVQAPTPSPVPSSSASTPTSSAAPAASPAANALVLPGDCVSLVPTSVVQGEFGTNWVPISYTPQAEDVVGRDFAARGGLVCLWGIPNSGAGMTVLVAERATATDQEQVAEWASAGLTECSPFLDACFSRVFETEVDMMAELRVLVEGFEIRIQGSSSTIDPLRVLAREAATNMGYV